QTIIMITHDYNLALNANRIITLEDGKIVNDEVIK
ncbi:MAG: ABC transporter ATP-binding protein, partial [Bacilli bacterium]|nr:ABC transporter ATP-binding protein [Bacilli bacterium]